MSTFSVTAPYPAFAGTDGLPLDNGYIWIGVANLSPQVNPIPVYFDEALTILAVQPIRTLGGYPVYQGTPARLYVESNCSIQVLDNKGNVIYTLLDESILGPGAFTTLTASGAVTLTGTGAMKLNAGTTAERPSPSNGMIRYNTTTATMEGYINSAWASIGSVTSVSTGTGLTGGPITSTGTISIDSTVATLTGTQTLTNKTLTSPTITGAVVSSMESSVITSGTAVASTSGTSIDFTGIPSWVKRITVMFKDVSTNGTSNIQFQLGTGSTTYTTTGYLGVGTSAAGTLAATNYTTGFGLGSGNQTAATVMHGQVVISNITGNNWTGTGFVGMSNTGAMHWTSGSTALGALLTAVRITTVNGTDTFDAGSINILFE